MGRASSAKKARLLAGPPSKRRGRLRAWPFVLSLIVVAGVGLVWQSTVERSAFVAFGLQLGDHWHAGFGVFDCGVLQPPSINIAHATGFDFHEDNIVHLHPASTRATGRRATLNTIGEDVGLHIGVDSITLADGTVHTNGDRCDETKATTQIKVWAAANDSIGRVLTGDERGVYTPKMVKRSASSLGRLPPTYPSRPISTTPQEIERSSGAPIGPEPHNRELCRVIAF